MAAIDPQVLERHGVTVESLKKLFTADENEEGKDGKDGKDEKKTLGKKELVNLIRSRINEGITKSLRESRHWQAIDTAFDSPFYQITPTLVRSLLSKKMDNKEVLRVANDWGLTHLIREEKDSKGNVTSKTLDLPAFFQILVPIAKAYAIIRTAKIFNDRNVFPLFKYDPSRLTLENKTRCDLITDRGQTMTSQYGYSAIMRQAIMTKNIYGTCLQFPAEAWHTEKQLGEDEKGKETEKIVREGLRYNLPHPSRVFLDLNYRAGTINTDTGCAYGGYWNICRYGDIKDNDAYWSTDKISYGTNWMNAYPNFFATIYPCVCKFPSQAPTGASSAGNPGAGAGAGAMDRESAAGFYAAEEHDKAVTKTELFMKFKPKKYGIGDYDYPVWFRLVVANESHVIYAEPLCYTPIIYRGYDAHEERELNSSLVLEALPFQDHIGNLLSQHLLTIKQNLLSVVFTNEDAIGEGTLKKVQNLGQKLYMEVNFIPYSGRKAMMSGKDFKDVFFPVNFPRLDTTAILQGVRVLLDMMERILVMSSQEIGAAASHEQTAEETRVIQSNTSNRLNFTASYDDDADLAWKKQIYEATMAYGQEEMYGQIEAAPGSDAEKVLEKMGFTVVTKGDPNKNTKTLVKGSKTALRYEEFASTRQSGERINNVALANSMVQLLQVVFSNPPIFAAVGPAQAIKLINQVVAFGGFYSEFKLEAIPHENPEEQNAKAQEQIGQMLAQLKAVLEKEMEQTVGAATQPLAQAIQQIAQQLQGIGQAAQAVPQLAQQMAGISQAMPQMQAGIQKAFEEIGQKDAAQDEAIARLMQVLEAAAASQAAQPMPVA